MTPKYMAMTDDALRRLVRVKGDMLARAELSKRGLVMSPEQIRQTREISERLRRERF